MTPHLDKVLMGAFGLLTGAVAPKLEGDYLQGSVMTTGFLLMLAAGEADRAVEIRVRENALFRDVLAKGAAALSGFAKAPAGLEARCRDLAMAKDEQFRLSALDAANAELRRALIELQRAAEEGWVREPAALKDAIWAALVEAMRGRKLVLPPL